MTGPLRRAEDTETERRRSCRDCSYVTTKENLEPPEAGRGMEGYFPNVFRWNMAFQQLGFKLVDSRTVKEYISVVLSQSVCSIFYGSSRKPT